MEGHAVYGLAGEELAAFGDQVDILVVGSRGYGPVKRLVLGSTVRLPAAPRALSTARAAPQRRRHRRGTCVAMFKNVLVGVDGSPNGRDAIALASQLIDPDGKLTLAHVHQGEMAEELQAKTAAGTAI